MDVAKKAIKVSIIFEKIEQLEKEFIDLVDILKDKNNFDKKKTIKESVCIVEKSLQLKNYAKALTDK